MSQIKINEMVLHKSRLAGRMIYHAQINAGGKPNLVTISRHVASLVLGPSASQKHDRAALAREIETDLALLKAQAA